MAKTKKGIFGPISGKLGPVIGSTWKGIPYLKTVNNETKKREPSAAQKLHHQKFSFLTRWLRPLHPYLMIGFKNLAEFTTEINAGFSYNFKAALIVNGNGIQIDHKNVKISRGNLKGIIEPELVYLNQNTLQLNWKNIEEPLSLFNDQLIFVIYNDELSIVDGFTGGTKRSAQICTFSIDPRLVGHHFHAYVGLVSLNGNEISESQYLGRIEP